jgi:hypothetical protein
VPEYCLKSYGYGEHYPGGDEYQGEGEGDYEGRD